MLVGINYPWKNYGWDFGAPPESDRGNPWGARASWKATIDDDLARFRALGLFCVRWFLLGDGVCYGFGVQRPVHRPDDDPFDHDWDVGAEPPPLSQRCERDFVHLLERCRAARVQLLPSLIDFRFAFAGAPPTGSSLYVKQGRAGLLADPARRSLFLTRTLERLLALAAPYHDVIYAFELINEPEWCVRDGPVPEDAMRDFLRDGVGRINAAGLRSTVGFADRRTLDAWDSPGLGVTLHQFHHYGGEPLPPHAFDPRWPAIIGEVATAPHRRWPDLAPSQDLATRLRHVEARGYPALFLWCAQADPSTAADGTVDWSDAAQRAVAAFTGR